MNRLWWVLVVAVTGVVGSCSTAWAADSIGAVVIVAGAIALGTVCLLGGLIWGFVAWAFRRIDTEMRNTSAGIQGRDGNTAKKSDNARKPTELAIVLIILGLMAAVFAVGIELRRFIL